MLQERKRGGRSLGMKEATDLELSIKCFGCFEVWRRGKLIEDWPRAKTKDLLKLLASQRGQVFSLDQLIEALFPDLDPERARKNLYKRISELRRVLEPSLKQGSHSRFILNVGQQSVSFNPDSLCSIDTEAFQKLLQFAEQAERENHWSEALEGYHQAIALYRGDFLAEDLYEEWTLAPREHWRESHLTALLRAAESCARLGQYARALEHCHRAIELAPGREAAYRQKMTYHALMGESHEAALTYQTCVEKLEQQLGVTPSRETQTLHEQILEDKIPEDLKKLYPSPSASAPPRHNLPQPLTSFIGRQREKTQIKRILMDTRLVTLMGFGGCGKTRLAVEVARDLVGEFKDGVWLVELAPLSDPALVLPAVASTLGVKDSAGISLLESLQNYLHSRELLLVLDNCEHLIETCAQLAEALLKHCPELRIMATSREVLDLPGETAWMVLPLVVPGSEALPTPKVLQQNESVSLFLDRALSSFPEFVLTTQNAPTVVQICRQLDGMPLAIELAAARVRALSVEQISVRLEDRFKLLSEGSRTAPRQHQTLRAAMDWSYQLLPEKEQMLFRRLAVFAGGWTLEAAEDVCADDGPGRNGSRTAPTEVLDLLTHLVEKSLVIAERTGERARYRLLETVRQYAGEKLAEAEEEKLMRRGHRDWFLRWAEQAEAELEGLDQKEWLERVEQEHDNLRVALKWSQIQAQDIEVTLRLAGALGLFWDLRGHWSEGRRWLEAALEKSESVSVAVRAKALRAAARLALLQDDYALARSRYEESLAHFRAIEDKRGIARALSGLGYVAHACGENTLAIPYYEEALYIHRALEDRRGIADALHGLGLLAFDRKDYASARTNFEESLSMRRALKDKGKIGLSIFTLGAIAKAQEDYTLARSHFEESLACFRELGDKRNIAWTLNELGSVATIQADYELARTRHEAGLAFFQEMEDKRGTASVLSNLGRVALFQSDYTRAHELYEESFALFQELRIKSGIALVQYSLGMLARYEEEYDRATILLQESLVLFREVGDPENIAVALLGLGMVTQDHQEYEQAIALYKEGLTLCQKSKLRVAECFERFAEIACMQEQFERTARLSGAAAVLREAMSAPVPPIQRANFDRHIAKTHAVLSEPAFAAACATGRAMAFEEAIQYALTV